MHASSEIVQKVTERFQCRIAQIEELANVLSPDSPAISCVIVHGSERTGKTKVTRAVLEEARTPCVFVQSQECITGRHLLERCLSGTLDIIDKTSSVPIDRSRMQRCETVNALAGHLETILHGKKKFVLVFDGIDEQREMPATLLPALARLNERVPNLTTVFIVAQPHHNSAQKTGVPHIHFQPYDRDEIVQILSNTPLRINVDSDKMSQVKPPSDDDNAWLWQRYCAVLWDSMAKGLARDLVNFRTLAEDLWPSFVDVVADGTHRARDFSRLMVLKRGLFQDEGPLSHKLISHPSMKTANGAHELSYFSKYLLCAAYLASFNPSRMDAVYFMKSSEKKKRRKGGTHAGRASKMRKIRRRLLAPSPFALERMMAIFYSILPHHVERNVDVHTQIATLTALKLLLRSGSSVDLLDPSCRVRVNASWDYVVGMARSVGFEIADYLAE